MKRKAKQKQHLWNNSLVYIGFSTFASISLATAWYYIFKPNVKIETETFIYIPTGSTYEDVIDTLKSNNIVNNSPLLNL